MRQLFAAVGVCGLTVGLLAAGDTPTGPTAPATPAQSLVEQLGAERFSDREAAAAALEKLGPAAHTALAAATRHENPEVRGRAAALLVRLKRSAESTTRLAARRVKLDYDGMPLGTAVNDLKARTGLNVTLDAARIANPLRTVTCRTKELPVWEALEAFCAAAGLREAFTTELDVPKQTNPRRGYVAPPQAPSAEAVPVVLIDGNPGRLPGDRSTAVRVLALPPDFPGHRVTIGEGEFTLCLDVAPAPGLNWQEVVGVKVARVTDSAGRPGGTGAERQSPPGFDPSGNVVFVGRGGGVAVAMRFDPRGQPIYPDTQPNPRVVPVPLRVATLGTRSLRRVEGAIYGEILVPNQHLITVSDPAKHTGWVSAGDLKFNVLEVKEPAAKGGLGVVKVQLESPSAWVAASRRRGWNPGFGWPDAPPHPSLGNKVEAFDAAGQPFPFTTTSGVTDVSDDGLVTLQTITYNFRPGRGLPAKLVVVGPRLVQVEVPFVLENVPLP